MVRRIPIALAGIYLLAVACGGGRTLDGDVVPYEPPVDDTVGVGGAAGVGGAGGSDVGAGGGGQGGDEQPQPMPIECLACIGLQCPETIDCITNPECIQGVGCAVTQCLDGGNPDLPCVANCFDGDLEAAAEALQVLGCIFSQCGEACAGTLPFP